MVLSDATMLPKYVKFLTAFSGVPYISTCGSIEVWPGVVGRASQFSLC